MSALNLIFQPIAKTNGGGNWETTSGFAGTFDGRGHVIYNLDISKPYDGNDPDGTNSIYKSGLFGTINGGTVKNLIVSGSVKENNRQTLVSLFAGNALNATFPALREYHIRMATLRHIRPRQPFRAFP